ncbi:hypothetical protein V8G54_032530 [Vigna mungo]|uniref:Uncharacterized protein n=1 Tax=Vigna mungo TaxID=3915 RepID=A0AAQ3MLR9_VIGMU
MEKMLTYGQVPLTKINVGIHKRASTSHTNTTMSDGFNGPHANRQRARSPEKGHSKKYHMKSDDSKTDERKGKGFNGETKGFNADRKGTPMVDDTQTDDPKQWWMEARRARGERQEARENEFRDSSENEREREKRKRETKRLIFPLPSGEVANWKKMKKGLHPQKQWVSSKL